MYHFKPHTLIIVPNKTPPMVSGVSKFSSV